VVSEGRRRGGFSGRRGRGSLRRLRAERCRCCVVPIRGGNRTRSLAAAWGHIALGKEKERRLLWGKRIWRKITGYSRASKDTRISLSFHPLTSSIRSARPRGRGGEALGETERGPPPPAYARASREGAHASCFKGNKSLLIDEVVNSCLKRNRRRGGGDSPVADKSDVCYYHHDHYQTRTITRIESRHYQSTSTRSLSTQEREEKKANKQPLKHPDGA